MLLKKWIIQFVVIFLLSNSICSMLCVYCSHVLVYLNNCNINNVIWMRGGHETKSPDLCIAHSYTIHQYYKEHTCLLKAKKDNYDSHLCSMVQIKPSSLDLSFNRKRNSRHHRRYYLVNMWVLNSFLFIFNILVHLVCK